MMKLIVLVVLACASYVASQTCTATGCSTCLAISGCHWCQDYYSNSFCTSQATASAAGCDGTGEEPDVFVTTPSQCTAGGCSGQETCSDCNKVTGCAWCTVGSTLGCIANTTGSGCSAFSSSSCKPPCPSLPDCESCLSSSCTWCATDVTKPQGGTCHVNTDTCASGETTETDVSTCPVVKDGNGAATMVGSVLVAAAALVL